MVRLPAASPVGLVEESICTGVPSVPLAWPEQHVNSHSGDTHCDILNAVAIEIAHRQADGIGREGVILFAGEGSIALVNEHRQLRARLEELLPAITASGMVS